MKSLNTLKNKLTQRFTMMKIMTETCMGVWATSILIDMITLHWVPLIVDAKEALGDNICQLEEAIKENKLRYEDRFYVLAHGQNIYVLDMKIKEMRFLYNYHNPKRLSEAIDDVRILNYEHKDDKLYIREVNQYLKSHV